MTQIGASVEQKGSGLVSRNTRLVPRSQRQWESFDKFVDGLCARVDRDHVYEDLQRIRKWVRNHYFYRGKQLLYQDGRTGNWRTVDPGFNDPLYVDNYYADHINSLTAQWCKSKSELMYQSMSGGIKGKGGARVASNIIRDWKDRQWKPIEEQREAKFAMICGNYFRYYYKGSKCGLTVRVPDIRQVEIPGTGSGFECTICGEAGPHTDIGDAESIERGEATCPACGSGLLNHFDVPPLTVDTVVGVRDIDADDLVPEVVDPMEVKLHLHSRSAAKSPYLRRKRLVMHEILESRFTDFAIEFAIPNDPTLIYQRALETSPGNIGQLVASGSAFMEGMSEFGQYWFEPEMYCGYVFPQDYRGMNGDTIAKGTRAIDVFPEGLYVGRIGMKTVDIAAEAKNKKWLHGVWFSNPSNVWGDGLDSSIEPQRIINEMWSLKIENAQYNAAPSPIINQRKIDENEYSGRPREIGYMNDPGSDDNPGQFIFIPPARDTGRDADGLIVLGKQSMEGHSGAFGPITGAPGNTSEPATRTAILRDQAVGLLAPMLQIKGQMEVDEAYLVLRHYQQVPGRILLYSQGEYDDEEAQWLETADIAGEFRVRVKDGSWQPRSAAEVRAAIGEASVFGNLQGGVYNPAIPQKARDEILESLNLSFIMDDVAPDKRKQRLEIERVRMMWQEVEEAFVAQGIQVLGDTDPASGMFDPDRPNALVCRFLAGKIPADVFVDNHNVHIDEVRRYLLTHNGMKDHPCVREALRLHAEDHMQGDVRLQQMVGQLQLQAAAPMIQASAAINAQAESSRGMPSGQGKGRVARAGEPQSEAQLPNAFQLQERLPDADAGNKAAGMSPMTK